MGPDFRAPEPDAPASWSSGDAVATTPLPERWWTLFGDDQLSALVESALLRNQDLQAALARVEQARAAAGLSRAVQYPSVSVNPSFERQRFSANRETPPGASRSSYTGTSIEVPLDVAYEIDLWGRLRRAREASEANARASSYDHDALSLAISAEVARTWFAWRAIRSEEDVVRRGAELRRRALEIVEGRARAGVGNDLDTSRARVELAAVEADAQALARSRTSLEHALAVLCGEAPARFTALASSADAVATTTDMILPRVPPGLPSDLLRRRPDVAAAIERLHEASARIGVTEAEAYPRLALTASTGFVGSELSKLLDASSRTWTLGADVSAPVFQGGAFDERTRAARAVYDERAADYRATLLVAFREVEDALSALDFLSVEVDARSRARAAAQQTFELADARYRQGLVSYLDVVDAARSELDARRAIVQLERVQAESTVLMIQAVGGGWSVDAHAAADN